MPGGRCAWPAAGTVVLAGLASGVGLVVMIVRGGYRCAPSAQPPATPSTPPSPRHPHQEVASASCLRVEHSAWPSSTTPGASASASPRSSRWETRRTSRVNDLLEYWESDPETDLALLYLESFGNPRRFSRVARRIGRTMPILAVKSGRTAAGARA